MALVVRRLRPACLALVALACASEPQPLYEGPPRPQSEVALIVVFSPADASLERVDGRRQSGTSFALAPGEHRLSVHVSAAVEENLQTFRLHRICELSAELEAGHRYELRRVDEVVKGTAEGTAFDVSARLVDSATGQLFPSQRCDDASLPEDD